MKITEIDADTVERLRGSSAPAVDLGEPAISSAFNDLLGRVRKSQGGGKILLLEWEGSKIPRGATINGKPIGWTQHGYVTASDGSRLGTYDRLLEFGGPSGQSHKMIIFTEAIR